jgi:catechol 2,3-dioxygenase-like lactoylglutathione lyase family enzyme
MAVATQAPVVERIDHWTLVSSDIERTKRFYTEVLGAGSRERTGGSAGRNGGPVAVTLANTTIDFFSPNDHQAPSPGGEGQHHCYVIRGEDFDTWRERFASFGVPLRYGNFGTRISLMFDDPDGYHFEFTVPMESREQAQAELRARGLEFQN